MFPEHDVLKIAAVSEMERGKFQACPVSFCGEDNPDPKEVAR